MPTQTGTSNKTQTKDDAADSRARSLIAAGYTQKEVEALQRDSDSKRNVLSYVWKSFIQIIPGALLGFAIDKSFKYLQTTYRWVPIVVVVAQLIVSVVVLYVIEKYLAPLYADAWINSTPGTLLLVVFTGVQFNLFQQLVAVGNGNGLSPPATQTTGQQGV